MTTKSNEHTPGPWASKATASLGPQYVVFPEDSGRDIAIVYDHDEHTEANARLIAAAPDLLDALQAIQQHAELDADDGALALAAIHECWLTARAAIRKVTGA